MGILTKIFGTKSDREIKKILPIVKQVNELYATLEGKDLSYLQDRTKELQTVIKESIAEQESKKLNNIDDSKELKRIRSQIAENVLEQHLIEAFALVKHACRLLYGKEWEVVGQKIKWEMIPYDDQIIGVIVLHQG